MLRISFVLLCVLMFGCGDDPETVVADAAGDDSGGEDDQGSNSDDSGSDDSGSDDSGSDDSGSDDSGSDDSGSEDIGPADGSGRVPTANVTGVAVTGNASGYRFAVTLQSDDTGCEQYANWWEVLLADGTLQHRRILGHSHVAEQPFTRSSGPVVVDADTELVVRAHMHRDGDDGYGGAEFRGSIADGFVLSDGPVMAEPDVEDAAPQPSGCAF